MRLAVRIALVAALSTIAWSERSSAHHAHSHGSAPVALPSTPDGLRFGYTAEGGAIFGAAAFGAIEPASRARTPPSVSYATTLWRWSMSLDTSYARGALIVPILGGFGGQAGGGTTEGRVLFGIYGGALLPGVGVRTPLPGGYTVETTARASYSTLYLGDRAGTLSRSALGARIDVRSCSNSSFAFCAGVAADALAGGRAYGILLTTGFVL